MNLGIVGHGEEKFTNETRDQAYNAIHEAIERHGATKIVSGHSPVGGVDIYAENVAGVLGLETIIHKPESNYWEPFNGKVGFKERNLRIARDSDLVLCIVVEKLPENFKGMTFHGCYHCKERNPLHVKSGGCWTAWKAKRREWKIL